MAIQNAPSEDSDQTADALMSGGTFFDVAAYFASRWLLAEAFGITDAARHSYYEAGSTPFFFDLVLIKELCKKVDATCIRNIIKKGINLTDGEWPNFVVSRIQVDSTCVRNIIRGLI